MLIGEAKGPIKNPEPFVTEAPQNTGAKIEKGEIAPDFEKLMNESSALKQAEIEKEKNMANGDFKLGETKDEKKFRQELEKITGKRQDKAKNKLDRDDYLNLLVTQLKYQDPSKPMDNSEMASQMAQFNTVEQLMGVNKVLTEMKKSQDEAKADKLSQYLGKDIEIQGNSLKLGPDSKTNTVKYNLPTFASNVAFEVHDENDKIIRTIAFGAQTVGSHKADWDGKNDKGENQPPGKYTFNILAAGEDGKTLTVKTSYMAKVEGITDITSGGKLDTSAGIADPAKIIAIRNHEESIIKPKEEPKKMKEDIAKLETNPKTDDLTKLTTDTKKVNEEDIKTKEKNIKMKEDINSTKKIPFKETRAPTPLQKNGGPPSATGINS